MQITGFIPGRSGRWTLTLTNGMISNLQPADGSADGSDDLWIAPGFFDMQVNGFIGHIFNVEETSAEQIIDSIKALWATGVVLVFPTLTTGSPERLVKTCHTFKKVMDQSPSAVRASFAGLHMEGPYISAEDGPRGAHDRAYVRPPSWDEFQRLQEICDGAIKLVTLAPELPGAIDFITKAVKSGVVVGLGHCSPEPSDVAAAVGAGASFSTHLGNGAHSQLPRHPNYIWEQLAADELWAGLVPDGYHLPPATLKCLIRAKGAHRCVLTTDVTGVAGLPPGKYFVQNRYVELLPGGPVLLSGTPFLAGSALHLNDGVANAMRFAQVSLADAIDMVTWNPAQLFNMTQRTGRLHSGMEANLTLFRLNSAGDVLIDKSIVKGEVVYTAQ